MITLWVMNIMFTSFSIHWWHLSYLLLWWLLKGGFLTSSFLLHLLIDILSNGRAAPFLLFVYINTDSRIIILLMIYKPWVSLFWCSCCPIFDNRNPFNLSPVCLICPHPFFSTYLLSCTIGWSRFILYFPWSQPFFWGTLVLYDRELFLKTKI